MAVKFFYRDRVNSPVLQPPTWGSTHFSRLLRHAWATVGLLLLYTNRKSLSSFSLQMKDDNGNNTDAHDDINIPRKM
jgi:hypothetical protein